MNQYLLSMMRGRNKSFLAQLIMYLLLPWSYAYAAGVFCHRNLYRLQGAYKAAQPVISVGNITAGGSGKTPLVIWLARHLLEKGHKPVILIRGYMPQASQKSDEVDMLNEQVPYIPVLAGADRVANIRQATEQLPVDVYICDDAFQHWPLYRDLNIVAIDALNPFGNGHMLPAGILREPMSSLKRADVFILTKTNGLNNVEDLISRLKKINPQALIMESCYKTAAVVDVFDGLGLPEDFLKEKCVVGFCAIGDPVSFEAGLKNSGAVVTKIFAYRDHHVYKGDDIRQMVKFCRQHDVKTLVTTHKDAVKLRMLRPEFEAVRLVYIPIQLEITKGTDEFFKKIDSICIH